MRKIQSVFVRDWSSKACPATPEVTEGCGWVLAGEGVATEKFDGTACMVKDGKLYKRLRVKEGKPAPAGWLHWSFDPEQRSGHGWSPVGDGPEDEWHREAWAAGQYRLFGCVTCELVGPKVQGNPYGLGSHELWEHGAGNSINVQRTFSAIREVLSGLDLEGIVFHHPDGRMAKVKRKDFGLQWPFKNKEGEK